MTTDQLLELATRQHRAGDLTDARRLYRLVLAESPIHPVALFQLGVLELQENRPDAAVPLISAAAMAVPSEIRYQFALGEALSSMGRWNPAAAAYRRAAAINPQRADVHRSLGFALASLGDHAAAIDSYHEAIRCQPDFADAFNLLGNSHRLMGDIAKAEAAYRRALKLQPDHAGAMSNLGTLLHAQGGRGNTTEAMPLLRRAVEVQPDVTTFQINLAAALCDQRNFSEALPLLRHVLEVEPNNAESACNLGNALHGLGQLREAATQYQKAIALKPHYAEAFNNLGNVCKELGEFPKAMAAYESAIRAKPTDVLAMNNAGCLLRTLGRHEEAEAMLRRGLLINPQSSPLWNNLGNVLKDAGQLGEAINCFRRAVELDPTAWGAHGNLAYSLSFSSLDGQAILDECLRWNQQHAAPLAAEIRPHANDRNANRRLRIGYVSPDFRDHCQSLFTLPLLSNHDHAAFEIFCYSGVERPDHITRQIAGHADVWREIRMLDDAALAEMIRADRIDILVDLTMHMSDGRPLLFARKPAPVQIAWLAYPGTTGMAAMDFRLSDPRLDPPGFESHYTERTIHLPDSFWCYHPLATGPEVNPLPALRCGHVTFGCLNNPCKLTDETLQLWAGVMNQLPTAQLLLMSRAGKYQKQLLDRLSTRGIAADRVSFVSYRPRAEYLKSYHEIDLGLDTFPYNGHTTSLDSFWMGVPVVTRVGRTSVGRGGLSQLFQLGLTELAADSDEAFVKIAVELASNLPRLAAMREGLRSRIEASPLMDGKRFAGNIETACRYAWENRQELGLRR